MRMNQPHGGPQQRAENEAVAHLETAGGIVVTSGEEGPRVQGIDRSNRDYHLARDLRHQWDQPQS